MLLIIFVTRQLILISRCAVFAQIMRNKIIGMYLLPDKSQQGRIANPAAPSDSSIIRGILIAMCDVFHYSPFAILLRQSVILYNGSHKISMTVAYAVWSTEWRHGEGDAEKWYAPEVSHCYIKDITLWSEQVMNCPRITSKSQHRCVAITTGTTKGVWFWIYLLHY